MSIQLIGHVFLKKYLFHIESGIEIMKNSLTEYGRDKTSLPLANIIKWHYFGEFVIISRSGLFESNLMLFNIKIFLKISHVRYVWLLLRAHHFINHWKNIQFQIIRASLMSNLFRTKFKALKNIYNKTEKLSASK